MPPGFRPGHQLIKSSKMINYILMDVEGTTTSIDFVHNTLFPYASRHLENFIREHREEERVREELDAVVRTVQEEEGKAISPEETVDVLLRWIKEDRKHGALKNLQGYLWKEGYEKGDFTGHLYEDVLPCWKKWKAEGRQLGIYSSGSVEAQQLLFGHSDEGDLRPWLSHYFDTRVGHKREANSYRNIQKILSLPAEQILFLSDVTAELDAAREAGFQTIQLIRPGTQAGEDHLSLPDFRAVDSRLN